MGFVFADAAPTWQVQLGIALPFILALGWIGRWLFTNYEQAQKDKDTLYEKIIEQVVPGMTTTVGAAQDLLATSKELREELLVEREARVRLEERLRTRETR